MTLSRRAALTGTAALIATTTLPVPAATAGPDIEATALELLLSERYEELTALLHTLPTDGDYPPLVSGLRVMANVSRSQLQQIFAID